MFKRRIKSDGIVVHRQEILSHDDLYEKYKQFYEDSSRSILEKLQTEQQRTFYKKNHTLYTRTQFVQNLEAMDSDTRDKYIDGLILGFTTGVEASKEDIFKMMQDAAQRAEGLQ